ncbi:MAG: alpha-xylosidase [Firmicutes bacterium]|nr:alpha-xylosidase [Bacillota bacterium]
MKFKNGYWLMREGVAELAATQVCDYHFGDGVLTLYCAVRPVEARNATVNAPLLTVRMEAAGRDTLMVHAFHHMALRDPRPEFSHSPAEQAAELTERENRLILTAGTLRAEISLKPFRIRYYEGSRLLTESEGRSLAYVTLPDGKARMKEELSLGVDENIYGLGERFTAFVKNGQSVDLINEDGGTASEQTYKNIPFYLSSAGYGVWIDTPAPVSVEVASEKVERVQFSVEGEEIRYCLIGSGCESNPYKGVLARYTALTGAAALPPRWSFGLWLSTSFVTDYDEQTVMSMLDGMESYGIPVEVFHYDCCWMKEFEWCNFTWRDDCFPDPEGMLRRIHERGIRVCVWINPYIAQKSPLFREAGEADYLLKRPDGSIWQTDLWQAGMGIVDFTNPEARKWYRDKLRTLLDMGVDCFKTDFGERIPIRDAAWFDGSDPLRMHNMYTLYYNQTVYELLREVKGEEDAVVFARSATTGSQCYPVHWGGDSESSYRSMAESLRGGLSLMLSGLAFWSHDIGGFEDDACNPDLYRRWTQFGLLSTHSRYHSSRRYKAPWLYGEEAVRVSREFTALKLSLMPYLWAQTVESVRSGLPLMRPMLLEFPADEMCRYLDKQYMLGESLLVAPIFNEEGLAHYYLPQGTWTHLLSGKPYIGGQWYTETYDAYSLPVFVRGGSVIIRGRSDGSADYDDRLGARICLYDIPLEGLEARCYDRGGREIASVKAYCDEEALHVVAHGFDEDTRVVLDGVEYPLRGGVLALV